MSTLSSRSLRLVDYSFVIPPLLGGIFALFFLYILRLPSKYAPAAILCILAAPLILVIKNKERFFLASFLFLLPVDLGLKLVQRYETTNSRVEMLFKFYLVDIFLIALFIIWLIGAFNKKHKNPLSVKRNKITAAILLWIGMGFFFLFPAVDRLAASLEVLNMLRIFLIFFLVFHYFRGHDDLNFIIKWLALGYCAQSILVIAQYATNSLLIDMPGTSIGFDIVGQTFRPIGTLGHSSHFAKYSGMMLPVVFSYAIFSNKVKDKTLYAFIWLTGSIALVLTISRAGIMTWILSIAAFFIRLFALSTISKRKFFRISVSFGLTICLALGITYLAAGRQLQDRMYDDSGSVAMRVPTFRVAFNVIRYNPIFGRGLG